MVAFNWDSEVLHLCLFDCREPTKNAACRSDAVKRKIARAGPQNIAGVVADAEVTARAALHLAAEVMTREEAQAEVHAMKERMQKMESLHANDCAAHEFDLQVRA